MKVKHIFVLMLEGANGDTEVSEHDTAEDAQAAAKTAITALTDKDTAESYFIIERFAAF